MLWSKMKWKEIRISRVLCRRPMVLNVVALELRMSESWGSQTVVKIPSQKCLSNKILGHSTLVSSPI